MRYIWDDAKNAVNPDKHGIDFSLIDDAAWSEALMAQDKRKDYGEVRIAAYVPIRGRLHVAIYAMRGTARRIISLRKANARERTWYEQTHNR